MKEALSDTKNQGKREQRVFWEKHKEKLINNCSGRFCSTTTNPRHLFF
jgi:hypothetical protein